MPSTLSRRIFLGSSAAAGALGTGLSIGALASSKSMPTLYGPEPGIAKLNANENPFGPSKQAQLAMMEAGQQGAYYVGGAVVRLKEMIAERHGLEPENVSLSSGSSGVLSFFAVAKSKEGKILGPDLFWDTTAKAAERQGGEILRLPKSKDLAIDLDALYDAITDEVSLVHVTNPNNPTGLLLDGTKLREFCIKASKKATVLVDEAYNEVTNEPEFNSMVPLVKAGHDVVVARTFSKIYGLAGMRVGYMLAAPEHNALIHQYGLGDYAMNQAGVAAAVASYNDTAFLALSKSKIIEAREMIIEALAALDLKPLASETNFIFVDLGQMNAESFRVQMQKRNVLIRGIYRDYDHFSRVSMGQLEDVERYVAALPRVVDVLHQSAT